MHFPSVLVFCLLVAACSACHSDEDGRDKYDSSHNKDGDDDDQCKIEDRKECCTKSCKRSDCCKCDLSYNNYCTKFKGKKFHLCELSGTYFVRASNIDLNKHPKLGIHCPILTITTDCSGKCQGNMTLILQNLGKVPGYRSFIVKVESVRNCEILEALPVPEVARLAIRPYLYNFVIAAENDAGMVLVACNGYDRSDLLLTMLIVGSLNPPDYQVKELAKEMVKLDKEFYKVDYTGCNKIY